MFDPRRMDSSDKATMVGILFTIASWWYFTGKRKYSVRGMR